MSLKSSKPVIGKTEAYIWLQFLKNCLSPKKEPPFLDFEPFSSQLLVLMQFFFHFRMACSLWSFLPFLLSIMAFASFINLLTLLSIFCMSDTYSYCSSWQPSTFPPWYHFLLWLCNESRVDCIYDHTRYVSGRHSQVLLSRPVATLKGIVLSRAITISLPLP